MFFVCSLAFYGVNLPLERGGCDEDIARVFFGMKLVERSIYPLLARRILCFCSPVHIWDDGIWRGRWGIIAAGSGLAYTRQVCESCGARNRYFASLVSLGHAL